MAATTNEAKQQKVIVKSIDKSADILGVHIASTNMQQVLDKIDQIVRASLKKPFFITTVNPEIVMKAVDDSSYKQILNWADLPLPDGVGLKLAQPALQIVPGRKLVEAVLKKNYKTFFLGGVDNTAAQMAQKYGGEGDPGEDDISQPTRQDQILAKINKYQPDILLVAYGAPYQERWIYQNLTDLKVKIAIGVGGALDYLTGRAKSPPEWISSLGLEWLWRLIHEPWRTKRQLNLVRFVFNVLLS